MRRTFLALLLLGATTQALAQTYPAGDASSRSVGPWLGGMLMRADTNGDGTIDQPELTRERPSVD